MIASSLGRRLPTASKIANGASAALRVSLRRHRSVGVPPVEGSERATAAGGSARSHGMWRPRWLTFEEYAAVLHSFSHVNLSLL